MAAAGAGAVAAEGEAVDHPGAVEPTEGQNRPLRPGQRQPQPPCHDRRRFRRRRRRLREQPPPAAASETTDSCPARVSWPSKPWRPRIKSPEQARRHRHPHQRRHRHRRQPPASARSRPRRRPPKVEREAGVGAAPVAAPGVARAGALRVTAACRQPKQLRRRRAEDRARGAAAEGAPCRRQGEGGASRRRWRRRPRCRGPRAPVGGGETGLAVVAVGLLRVGAGGRLRARSCRR